MTGKQRFLLQTRNLATRDNIGVSLTTPIPIKKWWNGNLNLFYNYSIIEADYGNGKTLNTRVQSARRRATGMEDESKRAGGEGGGTRN